MRLRFTRPAARQLAEILDYIEELNPQGARNVQTRIKTLMHLLTQFPQIGAPTSKPGLLRIVVAPYPYAITYRLGDGEVVIRGIRHTSRRPH